MKFTNKQIATTKNEVLKAILTNMKPQIQKSIDMAIVQEQKMTKRNVTEFGIECIEASLLFDLYKGVVSYTKNDDKIKSFSSGISIKGNFELYGVVVREGKEFYFITEAIIANGMINRAHYRYITKTNLPNARNQEEATKIKEVIKSNNKQKRMIDHISDLEKMKKASISNVESMKVLTREDWVARIKDGLLKNNWESFSKEDQERGYSWSNEQEYIAWLDNANEETIRREMLKLQWAKNRISQLEGSIAKEQKKLDKFLAIK